MRTEFRCGYDLLAAGAKRLTQVLLRSSVSVYIGGAEEIDTNLYGGVHNRVGASSVEAAAKVVAADPDMVTSRAPILRVSNSVSSCYATL